MINQKIEAKLESLQVAIVESQKAIAKGAEELSFGNNGHLNNKIDTLCRQQGEILFLSKALAIIEKNGFSLQTFVKITFAATQMCDDNNSSFSYGVTRALQDLTFDFSEL